MLEFIFTLTPILVPLVMDYSLWQLKTTSGLIWICAAWLTLSITGYFYLTGGWFIFSYYLRYIIALAAIAVVVLSLTRIPGSVWSPGALKATPIAELLGQLVPALIFTFLMVNAVSGRNTTETGVDLQFPLKGDRFLFAQAGASGLLNHHFNAGSQKYAQDIVQLNTAGRSAESFRPVSLEDYPIYGQTIYSPCDGTISAVEDGLPDLAPGLPGDEAHPAGNHIYLTCDVDEVTILLAHMQQGSVIPSVGNRVTTGEPVGRVGNSGNTTEPHLHIHARQGGDLADITGGTGIPITYSRNFYVRNNLISH